MRIHPSPTDSDAKVKLDAAMKFWAKMEADSQRYAEQYAESLSCAAWMAVVKQVMDEHEAKAK